MLLSCEVTAHFASRLDELLDAKSLLIKHFAVLVKSSLCVEFLRREHDLPLWRRVYLHHITFSALSTTWCGPRLMLSLPAIVAASYLPKRVALPSDRP